MGWAFFYMFAILKVPVLLALGLVWWAVRERPVPADEGQPDGSDEGGAKHPRPRRPRPPRRGPHGGRPPRAPQRVRAQARSRATSRR